MTYRFSFDSLPAPQGFSIGPGEGPIDRQRAGACAVHFALMERRNKRDSSHISGHLLAFPREEFLRNAYSDFCFQNRVFWIGDIHFSEQPAADGTESLQEFLTRAKRDFGEKNSPLNSMQAHIGQSLGQCREKVGSELALFLAVRPHEADAWTFQDHPLGEFLDGLQPAPPMPRYFVLRQSGTWMLTQILGFGEKILLPFQDPEKCHAHETGRGLMHRRPS